MFLDESRDETINDIINNMFNGLITDKDYFNRITHSIYESINNKVEKKSGLYTVASKDTLQSFGNECSYGPLGRLSVRELIFSLGPGFNEDLVAVANAGNAGKSGCSGKCAPKSGQVVVVAGSGGLAERLKAPDLKSGNGATRS